MMVWLDQETHRAFKTKAIDEGHSMAALMEGWIKAYIAAPMPATTDQINAIGCALTDAGSAGVNLDELRVLCPENFDAAFNEFLSRGYCVCDDDRVYLAGR